MPQSTEEKALRELEERLLDPRFRKSAAAADLLADSFLEFGSSGRAYDKREVLEFLRNETPAVAASLADFRATPLAPGVMLVTFRAIQQRDAGGPASESLRSSVWKLAGGRWQLFFHQGTRVP